MRPGRPLFRRFSLRSQLIAAFLTVGLVGMGLLALIYIRTTRQALIGEANQTLYAAASRTATSLDTFIKANLETIRVEGSLPSIVAYMCLPAEERVGSVEETIAAQTLDNLRSKDLFFIASYALLDKDGVNLLDSNISDQGKDESEMAYFQKPIHDGLSSMSAVEFAPKVGGVYFYFSSPVRNELGQIIGVLRSRYSVAALQRLVSESRGLAGDGSFAILLDENGLRLAHDQTPELIFKSVVPLEPSRQLELQAAHRLPNLAEVEMATNWPEFAQGLAHADVDPFFAAEEHTNDHLEQMAVVSLATQPWQVAYVLPRDVFLSPVEDAIQITVAWTAVFTIFLVAAAVLVARWLTKPVVQLTAVTEQITAGDLTAQAEVNSDDEIGQLAFAFNNMTTQLRQTMEGLETREEALQDSNEQLEVALIELQEAQAQMVQQERIAAVGQLAAGIAHDFNNIMATVILYSDLLLKTGSLFPKEQKRIKLIREQGQRAADLTQQILDFSRKSIMQRQDLDLWYFLVETHSLLVRTLP
ncbi:MAG: HAMP domain-containing protein, partial [Aquificales bacterium]|nr:HAMP domain-containing protein [Aquificales bacterium]